MGDSACVMHASQGNPMHPLGDSISLGRFMSESLAWEKWSTFSHKRYVEEAASYAQPGSVAQKKAFFEAHYKRKAAALLEQADAGNNPSNPEVKPSVPHGGIDTLIPCQAAQKNHEAGKANSSPVDDSASRIAATESGVNGAIRVEKSSLQQKSWSSNVNAIITTPTSNITSGKGSPPKFLHAPIDLPSTENPREQAAPAVVKKESSKVAPTSHMASKDCLTPPMTPLQATPKRPPATPSSEKTRTKMPTGRKTTGGEGHKLSALSKSLTACLSPDESATIIKQKFEDKFNAKKREKVESQKKSKKGNTRLRKLSQCFCFRAPPMSEYYIPEEGARSRKT